MPKNTKPNLAQDIIELKRANKDLMQRNAVLLESIQRVTMEGQEFECYVTKESDVIALRKEIDERIATQVAQEQQLKDKDNELFQLRSDYRNLMDINEKIRKSFEQKHNLLIELEKTIEQQHKPRTIPTLSERNVFWERMERRKMMTHIIAESLVPNSNETVYADAVSKMVDVAKRVVDEIERRTP